MAPIILVPGAANPKGFRLEKAPVGRAGVQKRKHDREWERRVVLWKGKYNELLAQYNKIGEEWWESEATCANLQDIVNRRVEEATKDLKKQLAESQAEVRGLKAEGQMYKDLLKLFKTDIATVEKASGSMVQSGTVSGTPVVEG